jgi:hypothetical protein
MPIEAAGHDCVYATAGWGIHDERWVAALLEIGFRPFVVSLGRDAADALELREAVLSASTVGGLNLPVLAGPLHSVTVALADLPIPVVGLSWGYDLSDLDRDGADLTWLIRLHGLRIKSSQSFTNPGCVDLSIQGSIHFPPCPWLIWPSFKPASSMAMPVEYTASEAITISGVSFELRNAWAMRPAIPQEGLRSDMINLPRSVWSKPAPRSPRRPPIRL